MAIKTRLEAEDEDTANLWHFQLYGPDDDTEVSVVKLASTSQTLSAGDIPEDWVADNLIDAQDLVNAGITNAFTIKQEAKIFLEDNPSAEGIIELSPDDLEAAIENRTAGQETLLLKTLSFAVRFLYAKVQENSI